VTERHQELKKEDWPARVPRKGVRAFQDLTGKSFGDWTVLARGVHQYGRTRWLCQCACGSERSVAAVHLVNGKSKSCGCRKGEDHKMSASPEYRARKKMIDRCHNPSNKDYRHYGGRGIEVCPEWRASFLQFLADMGPRPSPLLSVDRIDNDKGYSKDNCRWATRSQQAFNRRRPKG
jgi:hypothetical protein